MDSVRRGTLSLTCTAWGALQVVFATQRTIKVTERITHVESAGDTSS